MADDARELLKSEGRLYRKRSGLRGFKAFRVDDAAFCCHNSLEDVEYRGPGYYLVGLLGEVWRAGSFDSLVNAYELDDPGDEAGGTPRPLTPSMFLDETLTTPLAIGECPVRALPLRYRSDGRTLVVAARAPKTITELVVDAGSERVALHLNAPTDARGAAIDHGEGDVIVLSVAPTDAKDSEGFWQSAGTRYKATSDAPWSVNGAVFEATYEPA